MSKDQVTADRARIEAQGKAAAVFEFLESEMPKDYVAYWERLQKLVSAKIHSKPVLHSKREQMTDSEAKAFEKTVVQFGIHAGLQVRDVPPGYWISLTESAFQKRLLRYVKSAHFRQQLDEPPDDEESDDI